MIVVIIIKSRVAITIPIPAEKDLVHSPVNLNAVINSKEQHKLDWRRNGGVALCGCSDQVEVEKLL
jgi:hypothetical protein